VLEADSRILEIEPRMILKIRSTDKANEAI